MANPLHSDYCNCECPEGLSYDKLEKTLNRVRMLHAPIDGIGVKVCAVCIEDCMHWTEQALYPCATIRALEGDDNDA